MDGSGTLDFNEFTQLHDVIKARIFQHYMESLLDKTPAHHGNAAEHIRREHAKACAALEHRLDQQRIAMVENLAKRLIAKKSAALTQR